MRLGGDSGDLRLRKSCSRKAAATNREETTRKSKSKLESTSRPKRKLDRERIQEMRGDFARVR